MSPPDNVDRVAGLLSEAGYQTLAQPIIIGGIPFESAAILTKDKWLELITVVDTVLESDPDALRAKIEGLARALDLVESRRALTVILVGPRTSLTLDGELKQVARVLSVPAGTPADAKSALTDALAVLLPLDLSTASNENGTSWPNVRDNLRGKYPAKEIEPIFKAMARGQVQVRTALRDALIEPLDGGGA
jgi:hypothetical protein